MAMDSRTQFLLQLLQKLGAPLMEAVNSQPTGDDTGQKDAGVMAALLSESVKISISLSQAMNLKTTDGDTDAIRVALATLAGSLVADTYKQTGRLPAENDARRITKALEAVIVFADNFAPAAEHAQRLATLDNTPPFFDPVQTNIYSVHALLPAISAISEFSFGQADTRLIQEVAEHLGARAKDLQSKLSAGGNAMGELVTLQALAQIYAGAHRTETTRLKTQGEGATTLDAVWASFDKQVAMLEILMRSMGGSATVSGGGGGVKPAVETQAPAETAPPEEAKPAGNPMAFFKKK